MLKFEQKNQCAGCAVAEELPLKQGLKPAEGKRIRLGKKSCRGTSIKTRIETYFIVVRYFTVFKLQRNFH